MAAPYTEVTIVNYNSNPPSDDGAQTAANRVQWSTEKTKLADPLKVAIETMDDNITTAFGKVVGGAGITTTSISYQVVAGDQGKLVTVTGASTTITTPDATTVGAPFVFSVLNNSSGDITLDGSGTQTIDGALTTTVNAGAGATLFTDGTNWFTSGQNFRGAQVSPQGYLTPTTAVPIITTGVTSGAAVYYTPFVGNLVPIPNGTTFVTREFTELTLTLVSNHVASALYDVFLFDDSGTLTIGTGPAWNTATAGSGARGTGAGTTELQRLKGLYTNKVSMTARNGSTTYTVAANCGLYVGTIFIDGSAGQITCHRTYGQSRKWAIWNAFNKQPLHLKAGDASGAGNASATFVALNASSANSLTTLSGLPDESFDYYAEVNATASSGTVSFANGIGFNSTTAATGFASQHTSFNTGDVGNVKTRVTTGPPAIGIHVITHLFHTDGAGATTSGGEAGNVVGAIWRG